MHWTLLLFVILLYWITHRISMFSWIIMIYLISLFTYVKCVKEILLIEQLLFLYKVRNLFIVSSCHFLLRWMTSCWVLSVHTVFILASNNSSSYFSHLILYPYFISKIFCYIFSLFNSAASILSLWSLSIISLWSLFPLHYCLAYWI